MRYLILIIFNPYYVGVTSRKLAGSIPDGVIGIFHWHDPSCRTMAMVSTQSLKEVSTRSIPWGVKAAGA